MSEIICEAHIPSLSTPCAHYMAGGLCDHPTLFRCIEYQRRHEMSVSYSMMRDFCQCKRRYYWRYQQGMEVIEKAIPLRRGSIVSVIVDKLHSVTLDSKAVSEFIEALLTPLKDDEGMLYPWLHAIWGVMQAYHDTGKDAEKGQTQKEFRYHEPDLPEIHGFMDFMPDVPNTVAYEFKYTEKPDAYTKFTLQDQLTTYFLANPDLQRFTCRTITTPYLRMGKNESGATYRERVYDDATKRKDHYYIDRHYWRSEFDLDAHRAKIKCIVADINRYLDLGGGIEQFYQTIHPATCFMPQPCDYLSICENGIVSDQIYRQKPKEDKKDKKGEEVSNL